jgi:hypothetical protein
MIFFYGCSWSGTKKIIDNYEVSWGDYYSLGRNGYCLYCNPRCDGEIGIDDIRSVIWNNKIILIEKNNDHPDRWCIIKARGDNLQCCNGDTVINNIKKEEVNSIIKNYNYLDLDTLKFVK